MLEIIPADNSKRWNDIVRSMAEYDFYHLAEYHRLDLSGEAFLLHFRHETVSFALPVLLRKIEGTDYKDVTSVYGYAGPLSNTQNPDPQILRGFHEALKRYFDEQGVVSVFSRLHPLFENQPALLENLGKTADVNLTVGIDLNLSLTEQRRQYARSLKHDVNRLNTRGLVVKEANNQHEIDCFIAIYTETMHRVKASEMYFFPHSYFYDFLDSIHSTIFLAYYQEKPVSGSLFTVCNDIIQVHLNATKNDYLPLSPLKYVWDKIRLWGTENKLKYMHLGGGFGGKNDSLFDFKTRFSKQRFLFRVWKYIHNPEVYENLMLEKPDDQQLKDAFFPSYRS